MPLNLTPLTDLRTRILTATADEATDSILGKSNDYIPVDTATAHDSGRVVTDPDAGVVFVTYGRDDDHNPKTGQASNTYIVEIHEDMERHHPTGGPKFLQRAADEAQPGFAERVAGRVKL